MQHDEMIWQVIKPPVLFLQTTIGKALSDKTHFLQTPLFRHAGLVIAPVAHSPTANTLLSEKTTAVSLFMKTVERAHSPKKSVGKDCCLVLYQSLGAIDEHLAFLFPKALIHRNKEIDKGSSVFDSACARLNPRRSRRQDGGYSSQVLISRRTT
jgi:protein MAK16